MISTCRRSRVLAVAANCRARTVLARAFGDLHVHLMDASARDVSERERWIFIDGAVESLASPRTRPKEPDRHRRGKTPRRCPIPFVSGRSYLSRFILLFRQPRAKL